MRLPLAFASFLPLLACEGRGASRPPIDAEHEHTLERLESPQRNAWAQPDAVVAALPLARPDLQVADIGAGSGYFTRRIAKRVPEGKVYAIDVDGTYKNYIRDNCDAWGTPNIETRLALYENPLLPESSLDLVFLSNTYRFIENRAAYFGSLHDSLRSGGKLVIVDFRADVDCSEIGEDCPAPASRVAAQTVETEMEKAGFTLAKSEGFLRFQYMLVFERAADGSPSEPTSEEPTAEPESAN